MKKYNEKDINRPKSWVFFLRNRETKVKCLQCWFLWSHLLTSLHLLLTEIPITAEKNQTNNSFRNFPPLWSLAYFSSLCSQNSWLKNTQPHVYISWKDQSKGDSVTHKVCFPDTNIKYKSENKTKHWHKMTYISTCWVGKSILLLVKRYWEFFGIW